MLSSRIQLLIVILGIFFACRYHMLVFHGWSCYDVRADLGSLVSLKLVFGFGNQRFSFSFVCSFLSIATM